MIAAALLSLPEKKRKSFTFTFWGIMHSRKSRIYTDNARVWRGIISTVPYVIGPAVSSLLYFVLSFVVMLRQIRKQNPKIIPSAIENTVNIHVLPIHTVKNHVISTGEK